jgi:acyl-CoA reductase-like NAD-dependent aldehyde dehydrogenase
LQADVDKAVEAARKAFNIESPWRKLEPAARGKLMQKFASLLRRDIDYLSVRFLDALFVTLNKNQYLEIRNTQ